jgi:D-aspartate ligase
VIRRRRCKAALPPVILVGGEANAVSIARSLDRLGVTVHLIDGAPPARRSRAIRPIPMSRDAGPSEWAEFLLGPASEPLRGAVLLAGSDAGVQLLALNHEMLRERFLLADSNPSAQLCMLDKACTYEAAVSAGIPTPKAWALNAPTDIDAIRSELVFPLIVKPRLSHVFRAVFGRKFFVADSFEQVVAGVRAAWEAKVDVLLMEMIPGPDSLLCSYYTYLDEESRPTFDFTKRVVRRYPANMGLGTYHVTDHIPELRPLAIGLFQHVGLRGLATAEFKLDERDGELKFIECNARFTAANQLLTAAGFDLAQWVYYRIIGKPHSAPAGYPAGVHLWSPFRDLGAFLELRSRGELGTRAWIRSLFHRQSFDWFDWRDPLPSIVLHWQQFRRVVRSHPRR